MAQSNKLFTDLQPWSSPNPTKAIVYAYESLRISGILLQPFLPLKAPELLDRLGVDVSGRRWENAVWSGKSDAREVVRMLQKGGKEWKKKGHLFPQILEEDPGTS